MEGRADSLVGDSVVERGEVVGGGIWTEPRSHVVVAGRGSVAGSGSLVAGVQVTGSGFAAGAGSGALASDEFESIEVNHVSHVILEGDQVSGPSAVPTTNEQSGSQNILGPVLRGNTMTEDILTVIVVRPDGSRGPLFEDEELELMKADPLFIAGRQDVEGFVVNVEEWAINRDLLVERFTYNGCKKGKMNWRLDSQVRERMELEEVVKRWDRLMLQLERKTGSSQKNAKAHFDRAQRLTRLRNYIVHQWRLQHREGHQRGGYFDEARITLETLKWKRRGTK